MSEELKKHVESCPECSGPDDGCEEGQKIEEGMLNPSQPETAGGEWTVVQKGSGQWAIQDGEGVSLGFFQKKEHLSCLCYQHNSALADLAYAQNEALRREHEEEVLTLLEKLADGRKYQVELNDTNTALRREVEEWKEERRIDQSNVDVQASLISEYMKEMTELQQRLATAEAALKIIKNDDYPEEFVARASEDESARMFARNYFAALAPTPTKEGE